MTATEARALLAAATGSRLEPLYRLAIATGMRQGEMLGLRWYDVDPEAQTLQVQHTLGQTTCTLAEPKTESSKRLITLDDDTAETLRGHRQAMRLERIAAGARWRDGDHVSPSRVGTPLEAATYVPTTPPWTLWASLASHSTACAGSSPSSSWRRAKTLPTCPRSSPLRA